MDSRNKKIHSIYQLIGIFVVTITILFVARLWFVNQEFSFFGYFLRDLVGVVIHPDSQSGQPQVADGQWYLVTEVIDGDTIEIETGERVRYIGIDTPELNNLTDAECGAVWATELNQKLTLGKNVKLEKDESETDAYGRLLRYVYTVDGVWINEYLVQEGLAEAKPYPPDTKYQDQLEQAETVARSLEIGLWDPMGCLSSSLDSSSVDSSQ